MLRGIEIHAGKPIFHGLGHFAFDMPGLETALGEPQLAKLRRFGEYAIYPREGYPLLPFHPDSRMTMVALCWFAGSTLAAAGFVPCLINQANQPVPLRLGSDDGHRVVAYMRDISAVAGLSTAYAEGPLVAGGLRAMAARASERL